MSTPGFRAAPPMVKVVASGALLILIAALAFPLFARSYAASQATIADVTDSSNRSQPKTGNRVEGLGVRPLPLLSAEARKAHAKAPEAAIAAKGAAVFGDSWTHVQDAAATYVSDASTNYDDPSGPYGGYPYEYGDLDDAIAASLQTDDPGDIVDLASLLLISGQTNETAATAYSLLRAQALSDNSCDVQLNLAFALSLRSAVARDGRDAEYAKAVSLCGDDPTPAYALARDHLFDAFDSGCGVPDLGEADALKPVIAEFRQIQKAHTVSPAGYVGEAEAHLAQARQAQIQGQRPFWVRKEYSAARELFVKAGQLSKDPDVFLGEAGSLVGTGDVETAAGRIEALMKSQSLAPHGYATAARISAANGEYGEALQRQKQAQSVGGETSVLTRARIFLPGDAVTSFSGLGEAASTETLKFAGGCGSALTRDQAFVPAFRSGEDDGFRSMLVEYAFLARQPAPDELCSDPSTDAMTCAAIAANAGDEDRADELSSNFEGSIGDGAQNLWRRYGDLAQAESAAVEWTKDEPSNATGYDRLGETYFLQKKYKRAAASFKKATDLFAESGSSDESAMSGPGWARLRWSASLEALGQYSEARTALEGALDLQVEAEYALSEPTDSLSLLEMYVETLYGQISYESKKYADALDYMKAAIATGESYESGHESEYVLRGVQAQVASAAALQLDDLAESRRFAKMAVALDPVSPLYRETLAEADKQGSGQDQAIESYRGAVAADETLFSSWNNLGVLLGQRGDVKGATDAFRSALKARPDYAIAWFNYGTMRAEQGGISGFVASQGALGKAGRLDNSLRDIEPVLQFDEQVYDSGLDVSRAIPKDWKLAQSVRTETSSITLMLALVILLRVVWALGLDRIVGAATERGLRAGNDRRNPLRRLDDIRPHPVWMTAISLAVLLWLVGAVGVVETTVVGVVLAAMLMAHLLVPSFEPREKVAHASWVPASVVSLALGAVGLGFTPPAVLGAKPVSAWVRWSGPAVLGALAALFITVAWLTGVPSTRTVASAAMMAISSALVPVEPLDGARLSASRLVNFAITGALALGTVVFAAGWI